MNATTQTEFDRQGRPEGFQFHACGAFYFDGPGMTGSEGTVSVQFDLVPSNDPGSIDGTKVKPFRADNRTGALAWLIAQGVDSEVADIVTAHAFDHLSHAEYFGIDGLYRLQKYGYGQR